MSKKLYMKAETKIYSDFIKRNKIKVTHYGFEFKGDEVRVYKSENTKWWYAGEDGDNCYTKKAAIYYYFKNRFTVVNGIIQ